MLRGQAYYCIYDYDKSWADVQKSEQLGGTFDSKFLDLLKKAYINIYKPQGIKAYNQGDYAQAISDYTKIIEIDSKNVEGYTTRAGAYVLQNNLIKALSDYNKTIEIDPKNANYYFNRGNVYVQKR